MNASIYVHDGYGSHSRGHSGKLQIADLLYLWQLIYVRITEAMCSTILLITSFTVYEQVRKNNVNSLYS